MNILEDLFAKVLNALEKQTFKEVDNEHYLFEIDVNKNAFPKDVRTYVDKERNLVVQYFYQDGKGNESSAIYENSLPENADENKVTARLINGKLQVTIGKKEIHG